MARVERFEDLVVWQKARQVAKDIAARCRTPPMSRDFSMVDQIRASSRSTMANIAEGFGRAGVREFHRFLSNSSGSNCETRSHLYAAADCGYLDEAELERLLAATDEVARLISRLQSSLRRRLDSAE